MHRTNFAVSQKFQTLRLFLNNKSMVTRGESKQGVLILAMKNKGFILTLNNIYKAFSINSVWFAGG